MFEVAVYMFNSNFTLQQKFVTVPLRAIPLLRFHCRVIYVRMLVPVTRVNKIEAVYERRRVNVQVERGSPFTSTRELLNNASILFTRER